MTRSTRYSAPTFITADTSSGVPLCAEPVMNRTISGSTMSQMVVSAAQKRSSAIVPRWGRK